MTDREAAAGLVELRRKLAGVSCPAFGGDNLAIFLASEFEPGVEDDEMDESETWKQGAIDLSNQVMDAIHAHYAAALTALLSELESVGKERDEWNEKHNMLEVLALKQGVSDGNQITHLRALVAEAVRVCEPFRAGADRYDQIDHPYDDEDWAITMVGHLRAARAFIDRAKES